MARSFPIRYFLELLCAYVIYSFDHFVMFPYFTPKLTLRLIVDLYSSILPRLVGRIFFCYFGISWVGIALFHSVSVFFKSSFFHHFFFFILCIVKFVSCFVLPFSSQYILTRVFSSLALSFVVLIYLLVLYYYYYYCLFVCLLFLLGNLRFFYFSYQLLKKEYLYRKYFLLIQYQYKDKILLNNSSFSSQKCSLKFFYHFFRNHRI